MEFLGFCIFASAFMICDTALFLFGYKSFFICAKTDEEKEIHAARIKRIKGN